MPLFGIAFTNRLSHRNGMRPPHPSSWIMPMFCFAWFFIGASHAFGMLYKQAPQGTFNRYLLHTLEQQLPQKGGYATNDHAFQNLEASLFWDETSNRLVVKPQQAQPSFCSSACYMVLVSSLQWCASYGNFQFPAQAWKAMAIRHKQKDGEGIWGRVNSNGPGLAKLVYDLKAGVSFTDYRIARPGDFMKIFWTDEIGARERGHLVIFIRTHKTLMGTAMVEFWSSNQPDGYGIKSVPQSDIKFAIFTRITSPTRFAHVSKLPEVDEWLASMLTESYTREEVLLKCGILNQSPSPAVSGGR